MLEDKKIINFRYNRYKAQIVRLIAGKNLIHRDGELRPATVSDVLTGILDTWLYKHAEKYFPILIEDFRYQGVHNPAVDFMKDWIKEQEAPERELEEIPEEIRLKEGLLTKKDREEQKCQTKKT